MIDVNVRNGNPMLFTAMIGGKKVGGLYLDGGGFRDYIVRNAYGELVGQWGAPPPEQ